MEWNIDDRLPIWSQLKEQLSAFISSGGMTPGERIPSVRDLAADAGVNPNTMQRALSELEGLGLIVTNRTAGRSVTSDMNRINEIRREQVKKDIEQFLQKMEALGYGRDEILTVLKDVLS
ncbi:MAG TPA: GntR family transcriptional regulator, partial [Candidatus Avilachnospira avicola]|nr:GntR family transcriptional regulator [Candidatus Avilachnospira avicola]